MESPLITGHTSQSPPTDHTAPATEEAQRTTASSQGARVTHRRATGGTREAQEWEIGHLSLDPVRLGGGRLGTPGHTHSEDPLNQTCERITWTPLLKTGIYIKKKHWGFLRILSNFPCVCVSQGGIIIWTEVEHRTHHQFVSKIAKIPISILLLIYFSLVPKKTAHHT